jgi:hypothetical protein
LNTLCRNIEHPLSIADEGAAPLVMLGNKPRDSRFDEDGLLPIRAVFLRPALTAQHIELAIISHEVMQWPCRRSAQACCTAGFLSGL